MTLSFVGAKHRETDSLLLRNGLDKTQAWGHQVKDEAGRAKDGQPEESGR